MMMTATSGVGMKRSNSAGSLPLLAGTTPVAHMPRCISCQSLATVATAAVLFTQAVTDDLNSLATHQVGASLVSDVMRHVQLQALTHTPVFVSGVCCSDALQEASPEDRTHSLLICMATPIENADAEKEMLAVRQGQVRGSIESAMREHCDTDACVAELGDEGDPAHQRRRRRRHRRRGWVGKPLT